MSELDSSIIFKKLSIYIGVGKYQKYRGLHAKIVIRYVKEVLIILNTRQLRQLVVRQITDYCYED